MTLVFFIYFLFAIALAFYIPGSVVLQTIKYQPHRVFEKLILSLLTGMILWTYQGLIVGYLAMRGLTYIYVGIFFLLWLKNVSLPKIKRVKFDTLLLAIFTIGIVGQVFQFFPTGFQTTTGVYSIMAGADDGLWHTAMISELIRRFPPQQPGLSGTFIYNYHYLGNLLIAELIRIFRLPLLAAQFLYFPILVSFLLGSIGFVIARMLNFSRVATIVLTYLLYFSSDIIYLLTFITSRVFVFTVHPLEDGTMLWENPPRAFSYLMTLTGFSFLLLWLKHRVKGAAFLMVIFFASIIGFKVHTGLGVLGGLGFFTLWALIRKKWSLLWVGPAALAISALIYIPVNKLAGAPIFAPFEMARMFIVQPKLQLDHLELMRRTYGMNFDVLKVWLLDFFFLGIFLLAQFGIRNLGWIGLRPFVHRVGTPVSIFFFGAITTFLVLGTFFYQPIGGADIFNFYLAAGLFLTILTALTFDTLWHKKVPLARLLLVILLVGSTLPRWMYKIGSFTVLLKERISHHTPLLDPKEQEAFRFIETSTPKNSILLVANAGYADSMYPLVSAFTNRDTFLSGMGILNGHSIPYKDREQIVQTILAGKDSEEIRRLLTNNGISYLYFYGNQELSPTITALSPTKIFQNEAITLYRL